MNLGDLAVLEMTRPVLMLTTLPLSDLAVSDFGQAHDFGQVDTDTVPWILLNGPNFRAAKISTPVSSVCWERMPCDMRGLRACHGPSIHDRTRFCKERTQ